MPIFLVVLYYRSRWLIAYSNTVSYTSLSKLNESVKVWGILVSWGSGFVYGCVTESDEDTMLAGEREELIQRQEASEGQGSIVQVCVHDKKNIKMN